MTKRGLLFSVLAIASLGVGSLTVSGQGTSAPALVITVYNGGAPIPYTVPRTPWGDPDLQGVWSSDDTSGIPRERPKEFGNNLYLSDEAFAARAKQVEAGIKRAENDIGAFRNDFARRAFRQMSLIVDPPDGHMPAFTKFAETRRAPRDRGTFGEGPFETTEDFTLYDRCITRGIVGSVLRVVYGNGNRIVQAPGMVAFSYEMIHDTRIIYTDGRPHIGQGIRQYLGDSRARWEGEELVVVTTNLTDKTSIGANGATGHVIEYAGSAVRAMTIEERLTVCNMSIEAGARAGMVAPDEATYAYLKGRPYAPTGSDWDQALAHWRSLPSDPGARFDAEITLDAASLAPISSSVTEAL